MACEVLADLFIVWQNCTQETCNNIKYLTKLTQQVYKQIEQTH